MIVIICPGSGWAVMLCLRGMMPEEVFDALIADLNTQIIEQ